MVVVEGLFERGIFETVHNEQLLAKEKQRHKNDQQAAAGSDGRPVGGLPVRKIELCRLAKGVLVKHPLRLHAASGIFCFLFLLALFASG